MTPEVKKHIDRLRELHNEEMQSVEDMAKLPPLGWMEGTYFEEITKRYKEEQLLIKRYWDEETMNDCMLDILKQLEPGKKVYTSELVDLVLSGKELGAHPSLEGFSNNHAWMGSPYPLVLGTLIGKGVVQFGTEEGGQNYYIRN